MIQGGISALKLAPKLAKNIKSILGKEKTTTSIYNNPNKKTVRVRSEFNSNTDIPVVEEQYKHLVVLLQYIQMMVLLQEQQEQYHIIMILH